MKNIMKKRTLIGLLLVLCLTFTAVSGLAQGVIFSYGEGTGTGGGSIFSNDGGSVTEEVAAPSDSGTGNFSIDLLAPEAPAVSAKPICGFLPATWDQVYNDTETAKSLIQGKRTTPNGLEYTIPNVTIEGGTVSGVIKVSGDGFDDLKNIWLELGNDLNAEFDEMKEVDGIEDSLKAYAFTNDETYLRFEFIDGGSYRFIVFVALPQK